MGRTLPDQVEKIGYPHFVVDADKLCCVAEIGDADYALLDRRISTAFRVYTVCQLTVAASLPTRNHAGQAAAATGAIPCTAGPHRRDVTVASPRRGPAMHTPAPAARCRTGCHPRRDRPAARAIGRMRERRPGRNPRPCQLDAGNHHRRFVRSNDAAPLNNRFVW